jgi:hypothetical protein
MCGPVAIFDTGQQVFSGVRGRGMFTPEWPVDLTGVRCGLDVTGCADSVRGGPSGVLQRDRQAHPVPSPQQALHLHPEARCRVLRRDVGYIPPPFSTAARLTGASTCVCRSTGQLTARLGQDLMQMLQPLNYALSQLLQAVRHPPVCPAPLASLAVGAEWPLQRSHRVLRCRFSHSVEGSSCASS